MIRITDTPKPRDRFGSIPIRVGKPTNSSLYGPHLPRRPKKSFLWTWLKRTVGLVLFLALILLISSPLLVPYLATTLLAKKMAGALNRPVTIARAEFNPLTSTLTLHQLIVGPKLSTPDDPVDPLLSAGTISIKLLPERLLGGEVACKLGAEHFFLHLVRQKDGSYNLDQALDDLLPGLPVFPLRFSCGAIAIGNSRLVFDDEQTGKGHLAEELTLASSPGQASPVSLQAKINGIPVTLPDIASPVQSVNPEPTEKGVPDAQTPADEPALKTAEAIALVQELGQAARQYLQTPVINPPVGHRPETPHAP